MEELLSGCLLCWHEYQAVARDTAGGIMANVNITVRVSVVDSAAGGVFILKYTRWELVNLGCSARPIGSKIMQPRV